MNKSLEDHVATISALQEQPAGPAAPRRMTLNMGPQHPSTHGRAAHRARTGRRDHPLRRARHRFLHTGIENSVRC